MTFKYKTSLFTIIYLLFVYCNLCYSIERGIIVKSIGDFSHQSKGVGKFTAIIIGIDKYQDTRIFELQAAVKDATAVFEVLTSQYNFSDIIFLKNSEATWSQIDNAFRKKKKTLTSNDSLLIFFAGHGKEDKELTGGFWIPNDAVYNKTTTYIDNTTIIHKYINSISARHILLISDSCYSGTLFGETTRSLNQKIDDNFYLGLYNERSRWGMTSGNKAPVIDQGSNGHSIFTFQLLKILKENQKKYLTPSEIYYKIGPIIRNNSEQMPLCKPLKNVGDQGGQFVFILNTEKKIQSKTHDSIYSEIPKSDFFKSQRLEEKYSIQVAENDNTNNKASVLSNSNTKEEPAFNIIQTSKKVEKDNIYNKSKILPNNQIKKENSTLPKIDNKSIDQKNLKSSSKQFDTKNNISVKPKDKGTSHFQQTIIEEELKIIKENKKELSSKTINSINNNTLEFHIGTPIVKVYNIFSKYSGRHIKNNIIFGWNITINNFGLEVSASSFDVIDSEWHSSKDQPYRRKTNYTLSISNIGAELFYNKMLYDNPFDFSIRLGVKLRQIKRNYSDNINFIDTNHIIKSNHSGLFVLGFSGEKLFSNGFYIFASIKGLTGYTNGEIFNSPPSTWYELAKPMTYRISELDYEIDPIFQIGYKNPNSKYIFKIGYQGSFASRRNENYNSLFLYPIQISW